MQGEKMVLNMGPSHPSTHGVLRIILELDGEIITKAIPDVGYLHRGDEKIAENMTYTQFIPYTDRLDYLAPLANNVAYALAVEKLLGIHDKLPPRCQYIRVICAELARISSHLLGVGCFAMDVGAMTVFLLTFTEREKIYNLAEALSGARFTTSYTRIGGVSRDTPPGWCAAVRKFINEVVVNINETETLLTRNKIWVDRTRDVGVISKADAIDFGLSGPNLRGSGVNYDLRKDQPYLCYKDLQFDVPLGEVGDCYDRYLVRMEEMRQSVKHHPSVPRQDSRRLRQRVERTGERGRWQNRFAAEEQGSVEHGGIDSSIHACDAGRELSARRSLFWARKSEGRTWLLHPQPRWRHAVSDEDSQPQLCEPEHPVAPVARPHDERHGFDPGFV
jgi:NADH:ubiquinone oxidoreductase subunit D